MGIKSSIRVAIENLTGRHIYKNLPFGIDPLSDIISNFPGYKFEIIFDVGANIGQSALFFKAHAPEAIIYCFEPVLDTFTRLQENLKHSKKIKFFKIGLGSVKTRMPIYKSSASDMNSVFVVPDATGKLSSINFETIETLSLDEFCMVNKIENINYLKIDTEGFDLEVLMGGKKMLENNKADFIELEAGMNPTNDLHVPFEVIKHYLEINTYHLFGIYQQVHEWKLKKPFLRRCNPLFVSDKIVNQYAKMI